MMWRALQCFVVALLSAAALAEASSQLAAPLSPRQNAPKPLTRRNVYNCDAKYKKIEAQAWADAGAMADIAFRWSAGKTWQPAMDLFMGKNSVQDPYKGQVAGESAPFRFPSRSTERVGSDWHRRGSARRKRRPSWELDLARVGRVHLLRRQQED